MRKMMVKHNAPWLDNGVTISAGVVLGVHGQIRGCKFWNGDLIIGNNVTIGANSIVCIGEEGETIIGHNVSIGNLCNIGHNTKIGEGTEIGAGIIIGGNVTIGKDVKIKMGCIIRNRVNIADGVTVGMGSNVIRDLTMRDMTYYGNPCENLLIKETKDYEDPTERIR